MDNYFNVLFYPDLSEHFWIFVKFFIVSYACKYIIYSAYKKYSYPFIFFHVLLCCSLMLNSFELLFFPTSAYTPYTTMTNKNRIVTTS